MKLGTGWPDRSWRVIHPIPNLLCNTNLLAAKNFQPDLHIPQFSIPILGSLAIRSILGLAVAALVVVDTKILIISNAQAVCKEGRKYEWLMCLSLLWVITFVNLKPLQTSPLNMRLVTVTLFWSILGLPYTKMTVYSDTPFIVTLLAVGVQQNIMLLPTAKKFHFQSFSKSDTVSDGSYGYGGGKCFVGCSSITA